MNITHTTVLIVGGGSAGISVAARLGKALGPGKVTVLEPSAKHYYQPLWTLVGGGEARKEETERDEATLIPSGVTWLQEGAASFDPDKRLVVTSGGRGLEYNALVVAMGIQVDWHKVKGLPEALGRDGVCSNYSYAHVDKTWEFIRGFTGGRALFTHPATPIKCGGAPQKIMYLADNAFRRAGVREKSQVEFFIADPVIFKSKKYAESLLKVIARKDIQVHHRQHLIEIRPTSREAIFENLDTKTVESVQYDLLHVTPPMSAPDLLKRSPLGNKDGWVEVDKATLQHVRHPQIFSLGDCSSLPTSKTGAAIRKQAPVVATNIVSLLKGEPLTAQYDGYTSCPLVTGYGKLILAEFDYDLQPKETFPFDQSQERWTMYQLKKHLLPVMYWNGMLKGIA